MIAVTGAAGFIGSNLAHRLSETHALMLVDQSPTRPATPHWQGLDRHEYCGHHEFLNRLDAIEPDAIFHLGACSSTTEKNWDYLRENNIGYSQRLWNWCVANQRPFLYASSAATYGDGSRGFDDRTPPSELAPLNLYGKSKNDFDIWALEQNRCPPRWAGLKFFNVYGPRESHKGSMASVAFQAYNQILATGRMNLFQSNDPAYADGGQLRDFVYVDDCVAHMIWLWTHPHANGVYNSGAGVARSFFDLTVAVFKVLGREPRIIFIEMPAPLASQYQNYTRADMTKLRSAGCDVPATVLEDGIGSYVRWLQKTLERKQ